jgi:hypothetical protein
VQGPATIFLGALLTDYLMRLWSRLPGRSLMCLLARFLTYLLGDIFDAS